MQRDEIRGQCHRIIGMAMRNQTRTEGIANNVNPWTVTKTGVLERLHPELPEW
jgi:hypothetical protein